MEAARSKRRTSKPSTAKKSSGGEKSGALKFSEEADQVLSRKGKEIAESLGEAAAKGHFQSAHLLLKLSEQCEEKADGEDSAEGGGMAAMLADEAEWPATGALAGDEPKSKQEA